MERKVILNLAMSLDGYICDLDGGYSWIKGDGDKHLNTSEGFDFPEFIKNCDTVVMGKVSYKEFKDTDNFGDLTKIVATHENLKNFDNFKFISENIVEEVTKLKEQPGKNIWLFGGSSLVDNFTKTNSIDLYVIGIIPIILGSGRKLFLDKNPMVELHLDSYTVEEGLPILVYSKRS